MTAEAPVTEDATNPTTPVTRGTGGLISGILALLLSQVTLYLFIFTIVLTNITTLALILVSISFGVTLFCAGFAIILGHRDLHRHPKTGKRPARPILGLMFGYGTLLILAVTIVLSVMNNAALTQTSNMQTVCIQDTHALNCTTK